MPIAIWLTSRNAIPISFIVAFLLTATFMVPDSSSDGRQTIQAIRGLEEHYLQIKDQSPIRYLADMQVLLIQHAGHPKGDLFPLYLLLAMLSVGAGLFLLVKVLDYLYPAYNFIWGDYVDVYQRKKNLSYGIFVLVILGILISVIANFISGKILHIN